VTFSSVTTPVCTVSGASVTLLTTGTCTIQADQAGNASFNPAPSVQQSFTVTKANQTISFAALPTKTLVQSPVTVSATASSGLAVTFTSVTTPVCTVNGASVTLLTTGTCTIQADQAGNATYNAAPPAQQSFTVSDGNQTIVFGALSNTTLLQSPVTVSATASSGLTVTFSTTTPSVCTAGGTNGATISLVATGTCTVEADQTGNATFNPAPPVLQSFTVAKANQTITFNALGNKTLAQTPVGVSATASSGLAVTFSSTTTSVCTVSGASVALVGTGTCTVQADQAGNATYNAAPSVQQSFTVTPVAAGVTVDTTVFEDGHGPVTSPAFSTTSSGDVLVAFVGSDGPNSGQTTTVSGAGLIWTLVRRTNTRGGTAEIWRAIASGTLANATVTSTQGTGSYDQSLTVVAFAGAAGVGTSATANASTGAPTVSLTTTKAGSWVYAVGNDFAHATARTVGPGQTMVHQFVDTTTGDTYWTQAANIPTAASGTLVTINDTAPTTDSWNFSAVEIQASP